MSAKRVLEIREEIANLRELIASGASSVTEDGHTTNFRPTSELRKEVRLLEEELRGLQGRRRRRPLMGNLDLSTRF